MKGLRYVTNVSQSASPTARVEPSSFDDLSAAAIIVGTSCAGTGIDLDSVDNVVVVGLPYSIEQLLQWAGRLRRLGTITVLVPVSHMKQDNELTGTFWGGNVCVIGCTRV